MPQLFQNRHMLQRYLIYWLVLSSLVALFWHEWIGPAAWDPFVSSKPYLTTLIIITMYMIGLLMPRREVDEVFQRWPLVFAGAGIQYTAMPLLAFLLGHAFQLEGDAFVGVVLVGCVPGAMASNVLTMNARGNTSYSVSLTTAATLLSPLAVPVALRLALTGQEIEGPGFLDSSLKLLKTVVIPVTCGHLSSRWLRDEWQPRLKTISSTTANLSILWIIAAVVGLNRDSLWQIQPGIFAVLLTLNLSGYAAGFTAGGGIRLNESMRRALTLEVGMQNAGLGAVLAGEFFPDREAVAIGPALYTFGCMLTGTLLSQFWSRQPLVEQTAAASREGPTRE